MSDAITNLQSAMLKAIEGRPSVGGFPFLAETLRAAGVKVNKWTLPSCQSLYITELGNVVMPGQLLVADITDVPQFDELMLIHALRTDQAGNSTFPQFLEAIWLAGVVSYTVDFSSRHVTYFGVDGQSYVEDYPAVEL